MNYAEVMARSTNSEDALTERVFGLLRYLPASEVVTRLMAYARWTPEPPGGSFEDVRILNVHFWPRTRAYGIPDVLLLFESPSQSWAVVVECKYGSGKSQWGEVQVEQDAMVPEDDRADQLARYWRALRSGALEACPPSTLPPESGTAVLYLTDDLAPPVDEILESTRASPSMRLGWLSWGDVLRICEECCTLAGIGPAVTVTQDLVSFLTDLGVVKFSGFSDERLRNRLQPHQARLRVQPLWSSAALENPPRPNVMWGFQEGLND